jgi:phosphotransacetylase
MKLPDVQSNWPTSRHGNRRSSPAASAACLLKVTSGKGVTVGPVLLGAAKPVHILGATATVLRIVNMTALAVANVQAQQF